MSKNADGKVVRTKRQVWLEKELTRLSKEIGRLADENEDLKESLYQSHGDPKTPESGPSSSNNNKVVSPDEINLETDGDRSPTKRLSVSLADGAEAVDDDIDGLCRGASSGSLSAENMVSKMAGKLTSAIVKGSALGLGKSMQAGIFLVALAGVLFVLIGTSVNLGGDSHGAEMDTVGGVAGHESEGHGEHTDAASGHHETHDSEDHGSHGSEDLTAPQPHHNDSSHGAVPLDEHHAPSEHTDEHHAPSERTAPSDEQHAPSEHKSTEEGSDGHHRRMSSSSSDHAEEPAARGAGHTPLMKNIAISLTGCGLIALIVQLLQQPLILGYLLGGVLVGPIGLGIVQSHEEISELSSLGLIFLLFMIGLELDVKALLKMGKVVLLTGLMQFPICAGIQIGIFMGLEAAGVSFGSGPYASLYAGMVCGISSTMIVAKTLGEKGETDSQPGRLTIGILIFQDIWAIVVLAIQPNLANPEILGILKTFGMIAVLIAIALAYAKFVMPAVLYHTSRNLELMLVMCLAWCFFICCTAILPFVGLSMELAALIAGVALATFPYSAEFNGKIKYIRDFFITLFFAGLGMQIPVPSFGAIAMGLFVALVVLTFRWLGIFTMVVLLGGGPKLGALATINLSQISEFALVICSLGIGFGHITDETMTIIIWTFAVLAISASYLIGFNLQIYNAAAKLGNKLRGVQVDEDSHAHGDHEHHEERDIVLLGYHKIAFMLIAEIKAKSPQLLKKIHVIDFNQSIMPKLREIGLQCTYGDIASPDVLEHAHHGGEPRIVISTIPDSMLRGINNAGLVKVSKQVWPSAHVIATADSPEQAKVLYGVGADYVVRMAKLCAERLHELLAENRQQVFGGGELQEIFETYKHKDKDLRAAKGFIGG